MKDSILRLHPGQWHQLNFIHCQVPDIHSEILLVWQSRRVGANSRHKLSIGKVLVQRHNL